MKSFDAAYSRANEDIGESVADEGLDPSVQELIREYGGSSYDEGLYRIFNAEATGKTHNALDSFE